MKYWFYSEGNILGPYAPAELLSMPAFGQGSLVCPENSGGDNPGDWRPAEDVSEIAEALSVGVGGILPGQYGAVAGSCEPSGPASAYYEAQNGPVDGYGNLLDTIDNILGAYKEAGGPSEVKLPPDFELMHNFDIRLSKIQEELEAARWEKNLLLEKMRSRDSEERKNKELIAELEDKLQEALRNASRQEKKTVGMEELETVRGEKNSLLEKIRSRDSEERKDKELIAELEDKLQEALKNSGRQENKISTAGAAEERPAGSVAELPAAVSRPVPEPENTADKSPAPGPAPLKKLRSIGDVRLEEVQPAGVAGGNEGERLTVKPLWGASQNPAPGGERFSVPAEAAVQTPHLAAKAGGASAGQAPGAEYDFGAIARPPQESSVVQPIIVPPQGPQIEGAEPVAESPAQNLPLAQQPQPVQPASVSPLSPGQPGQITQTQTTNAWFAGQAAAAHAQPSAETIPVPHLPVDAAASLKETAVVTGKQTERVPLMFQGRKEEAQKSPKPPVKGRRKTAFVITLIVFASVAVLGLVLFFFSGGSLSNFSMLNFGGGKTPDASVSGNSGSQPEDGQAAYPGAEGEQAPAVSPVEPAFESASNENTGKAIETVKAYKLSGGRGTVEVWFANSFLSSSGSGSNEEWSATMLHGDIFLVQYRLLRPKLEPLSYEFEVDVAKEIIVRGINNNAMELLESNAASAPVSKPKARKNRRPKPRGATKPKKPEGIPLLPLPEPAARAEQDDVPTGFETASLDGNEKVKYIVAQESDEELF